MKHYLFLPVLCLLIASCSSTPENETSESSSSESPNKEVEAQEVAEAICTEVNSFIPEGWKIVKNEKGDLNKDGVVDAALVIQKTDASLIKKTAGGDMNSNPRNLLVLFGTAKKGCFELGVKNETFIISHEDEIMDDPFQGIEIKNGTLKINFMEFRSVGSWETSQKTFVWRFQDGEFKLIGANESSFHRSEGDATDVSVNFSTKKYSVTTYNMFDESVKEEVVWKKFDLKELKTFKTFKAPWTVTINPDIHL